MQEHNQLLFIQRCLLDRLNDKKTKKLRSMPIKPIREFQDNKIIARRIREIQDRLKSVKLINKTLNICKQHLQCVNFYFKSI
jgi:hypothetical protein